MKRYFILSILIVVMISTTAAQDVLTLKDCMQYAIKNAPKAKKKLAEINSLNAEYRDAALQFLPEIYGNVSATTSFGRSIDPETNTYADYTNFSNGYSLSANYTLFNGFTAVNSYKIAKNAKAMGVIESQQIEDEICLGVIQAYYNVLYYLEMSDLAQQQLEETQNSLKLTKKQQEQGIKGYADVVEVEATVAEKEYNVIQMQNSYANAFSVLKQVMFFPIDDTLAIDRNIEIQIDKIQSAEDVLQLIEQAKNILPSALIAQNTIKKARLTFRTSKWSLLPSLTASASYSTNYVSAFDDNYTTSPFWDQLDQRQGEYVQLYLSIPIFNGLQRQSAIRKNKNKLNIAEYDYQEQLKAIEVDVELAVQDKEGALKSFVQADKRAKAQQAAYNLNLKRYEQGLISALELQTSSNNLLLAEAERLKTFFQYNLKDKVVKYYKGTSYIEQ